MSVQFLSLAEGSIAYQRQVGEKNLPGVIFLSGFASDMTGSKAAYLADFCARKSIPYLRFDYIGCGQSTGELGKGTIGLWLNNTIEAFDKLTSGEQIVVGSSMGGWLGLILAQKRAERIKAVIGIAAAPDFTEDLIWNKLTETGQQDLFRDGEIRETTASGEVRPPITLNLIEEARTHLVLRNKLNLYCPIRLLQGMADEQVPWQHSVKIANAINHKDVQIHLIKDGDHRLSTPENLGLIGQSIMEFV